MESSNSIDKYIFESIGRHTLWYDVDTGCLVSVVWTSDYGSFTIQDYSGMTAALKEISRILQD